MKIAIITGGSRGIGRSSALQCARRGMGVILTYNNHSAGAEGVVRAIEAEAGKAVALKLDVAEIASFTAFRDAVKDRLMSVWGGRGAIRCLQGRARSADALYGEGVRRQPHPRECSVARRDSHRSRRWPERRICQCARVADCARSCRRARRCRPRHRQPTVRRPGLAQRAIDRSGRRLRHLIRENALPRDVQQSQ
jgi:hypothetical protein